MRNLKVQMKAALSLAPTMGKQGGWEPRMGAVEQLARFGSSAVRSKAHPGLRSIPAFLTDEI